MKLVEALEETNGVISIMGLLIGSDHAHIGDAFDNYGIDCSCNLSYDYNVYGLPLDDEYYICDNYMSTLSLSLESNWLYLECLRCRFSHCPQTTIDELRKWVDDKLESSDYYEKEDLDNPPNCVYSFMYKNALYCIWCKVCFEKNEYHLILQIEQTMDVGLYTREQYESIYSTINNLIYKLNELRYSRKRFDE